jgi:hypothetical protein
MFQASVLLCGQKWMSLKTLFPLEMDSFLLVLNVVGMIQKEAWIYGHDFYYKGSLRKTRVHEGVQGGKFSRLRQLLENVGQWQSKKLVLTGSDWWELTRKMQQMNVRVSLNSCHCLSCSLDEVCDSWVQKSLLTLSTAFPHMCFSLENNSFPFPSASPEKAPVGWLSPGTIWKRGF